MPQSVFRSLLFTCLTSVLALAQGYETQFTESKYDRSKAPTTLHGNLEVDHASGAVTFDIPLGPGIGARGLKFVPTLQGRWAPQVQEQANVTVVDSSVCNGTEIQPYTTVLTSGGFSYNIDVASMNFSYPGAPPTRLPCYSAPANHDTGSNYMTHDGHGSKFNSYSGDAFPGNITALLSAFDFDPPWSVSQVVHNNGDTSAAASRSMTIQAQDGSWVIGLSHPSDSKTILVETVLVSNVPKGGSNPTQWQAIPGRILVIRGDLAYEYGFLQSEYTGRIADPFANTEQPGLYSRRYLQNIRYGLVSIRNRAGDKIAFSDVKAQWFTKGATSPSASVTYQGAYTNGEVNPTFTVGITNQVPNMNFHEWNVFSYSAVPLDANGHASACPDATIATHGAPQDEFQVSYVLEKGTNQRVDLTYFSAPTDNPWIDVQFSTAPENTGYERYFYINALAAVVYSNGHSIGLDWDIYEYFREIDGGAGHWGRAYNCLTRPGPDSFRCWFWGVNKVTETDTGAPGSPARVTTHSRVVPKPSFLRDGNGWASTTFYDAVILPDGSSELYLFANPVKDSDPFTPAFINQRLAYLKHVPIEIRHFAVGVNCIDDISKDVPVARSSSKAWKIEAFDRFTLVDEMNPNANLSRGAIPKPTRHRVWNTRDKFMTLDESRVWDITERGWKKAHHLVKLTAQPDDEAPEWTQPVGDATYAAGPGERYDQSFLTHESLLDVAIYGRKISEQVKVDDNAAGADLTLPHSWSGPTRTWSYDSSSSAIAALGRLSTFAETSGGLTRTVSFTYRDDRPTELTVPQSVKATITGTSGDAGATYGYDERGILNSIKPNGMTASLGQNTGPLGFVLDQTDFNGLLTRFTPDSMGRYTKITPPGIGAVTYTYDDDQRGVKVTRIGTNQWSQDRFNAFGEKTIENRQGDVSTLSQRGYFYNTRLEKVGENVWDLPALSETAWSGGVIGKGTLFQYDEFHRPTLVTDPNGVVTATTYAALSKTVTVGGLLTTMYTYDVVGRLSKVQDALGQITNYAYDPEGRISVVIQNGTASQAQVRGWVYDALGRLVVLDQPESGVTYFNNFEAHGGAGLSVYGLPKGWRPQSLNSLDASAADVSQVKTINRLFYLSGQVKSEISNDGSVNQAFAYDEPGHGYSMGKLTTANAQGVMRQLTYGATNGGLTSITYRVDNQTWTQGLSWNTNDGTLASRTYPDGNTQALTSDTFKALPINASFTGINSTILAYDRTHWGLSGITFGNNVSSFFTYDNDQTRLKTMAHVVPSILTKSWAYHYDSAGRLSDDSEDYYRYDLLSRLTTAHVRGLSTDPATQGTRQMFSYLDGFGNRTNLNSMTISNWAQGAAPPAQELASTFNSNKAQNYDFNSSDEALVRRNQLPKFTISSAGTGANYDVQGNLLSIYKVIGDSSQSVSLTYDALGRVKTMSDAALNTVEIYTYDDQGLRVMTEVYQGPVVAPQNLQMKRYRIYNEARQIVAEYELVME